MKSLALHISLLTMLWVLCFASASAQDGTTAYEFLNISPSARVYGLGGHNITVIDDDINLVDQNPALLGPEFNKQVGLSYMHYIGSANFMGARYGQGLGEHGAIAGGIQYYGYGELTEADVNGSITGKFSASDVAFNVAYSHDITDYLRGGINVKMVLSNYADFSAVALATDLGINYYNPDNDLSLSLVLRNLGGQVKKFNQTSDKLPWDIQLGMSKGLGTTPFRLSVTAVNLTKWKLPYFEPADKNSTTSELVKRDKFMGNLFRHLVFGLEFLPHDRMYVGLGYNYKTRTDMSTYSRNLLSGFSLGAGMKVKAFGFGVALAQPHTGATTFMLNLATSIGDLLN